MNERATLKGVGFGDGKTGAGDRGGNTETVRQAARKGGFAGADIADKLDNASVVLGGWEIFKKIGAKLEHGGLGVDEIFVVGHCFHVIIIA